MYKGRKYRLDPPATDRIVEHVHQSALFGPGPEPPPVIVSEVREPRPAASKPRRAAVPDVADHDQRPDPLQATCAAELVDSLKGYHQWAGEPAIRTMAEQCDQLVSAATLYRAMNKKALPSFKAVQGVIIGCGGPAEDQRRFATAWRRIRSGRVVPARNLRAVPAAKTG